MAYGQNGPQGLQSVNAMGSAPFNAQTMPATIKPGYNFNIFQGDLVYIGSDGYLHNLAEQGGFATLPSWGVFTGCSYIQPSSANPADPASPARSFWPANTQTLNNLPVTAYYILDPGAIYTIQANATGVGFADIGSTASVVYTNVGPLPNPGGDTNTGLSNMALDGSTIGTAANKNLKIIGFDPNPLNPIVLPGAGKVPFVNVLVMIQNHTAASRPVSNT
jgi:hypothetical protein